MMTSHGAYPSLDGGRVRPATLSPEVMTGILRRELGFKGVLISDDLGMGAINDYCPIEEAVWGGLSAGVDIFLLCHSPDQQKRARAELEKLAAGGGDAGRFIERSAARIAALKSAPRPGPVLSSPAEDGDQLASRIAREAITISPPAGPGPLLPPRFLLVWFRPERTVEVESVVGAAGPEGDFRAAGLDPEVVAISLDPGPEERAAVNSRLIGHQAVLLTSYDAYRFSRQRELIRAVLNRRPGSLLAVLRDPRDGRLFDGVSRLLVTRGSGAYSLRALARVLAGKEAG